MSGPDFEGVMWDHLSSDVERECIGGEWVYARRCDCGWIGPSEAHMAHLSAALHAELARWADELADNWDACDEHGNPLRDGSFGEAADELRAAFAALTTTDQKDHR